MDSNKDLALLSELKALAISRQQYSVAARLRAMEKFLRRDLNREYTEQIIARITQAIHSEYGKEETDLL